MEQLRALLMETKQSITCSVCMEDLCPELKDRKHARHMTVFQCGHHLHHECAYQMKIAGQHYCPQCRSDITSQLARLEAPDPNASDETYDIIAIGLQATAARSAAANSSDGTFLSRHAGKCKACFQEYPAGEQLKRHSSVPSLTVHASCASKDLGQCTLCSTDLNSCEHVAADFKEKKLACKDCAVENKWRGASLLGKRKKVE